MSEGKKHDQGKPMVSLLPSTPVLEVAKVLTFGAKKYDSHNWRAGINYSRIYDAVFRHILASKEGEEQDPESGLNHLAHAACGLLFLLEYQLSGKYTKFDDRYKKT
jgi:hypothetical protein